MSRPGYAGKNALWIPNTASASTNSVAAEARVPTQASNACDLEAMRGRVAEAMDTRPSLPRQPERRPSQGLVAATAQTEYREQEGREENLCAHRHHGRRQDRKALLLQRSEAV